MSTRLRIVPRLLEATTATAGKSAEVLILTSGQGSSGFYPPSTLKRAIEERRFEGQQAFIDHTGPGENPEGSLRRLAGYYRNAHLVNLGPDQVGIAATLHLVNPAAVDLVREALAYKARFPDSDQELLGISIDADGESEIQVIQGQPRKTVTEISRVLSADLVTKAGRGGRVLSLQEAARKEGAMIDNTPRLLAGLSEDYPDLLGPEADATARLGYRLTADDDDLQTLREANSVTVDAALTRNTDALARGSLPANHVKCAVEGCNHYVEIDPGAGELAESAYCVDHDSELKRAAGGTRSSSTTPFPAPEGVRP